MSNAVLRNWSLNTVDVRKPIRFPDGTTQSSASAATQNSLVAYNTTTQTTTINTNTFSWTVLLAEDVQPGVYQLATSIQLDQLNVSQVTFDYFEIKIAGSVTASLAVDRTFNQYVQNGDVAVITPTITFGITSTQDVSLVVSTKIASPSPITATYPTLTRRNFVIYKVCDLPV